MTDQQTQAQTTTTYDNASTVGTAYPLAHRPHVIDSFVTLTDSGRFNERITTTTYQTSGNADGTYVVVLPAETLRQEFEGIFEISNDLIRSIDTTLNYGNFGNLSQVTRKTGDGYTDTFGATYQEDPNAWLISAQAATLESSSTPGGANTTRLTYLLPDPNTGAILAQTVEPNGNEDAYQQTSFQVDSHGIPTSVEMMDKSGRHARHMRLGFDAEDLYLSFTANSLGHVERFAFQPAFGVISLHEDINENTEKRQYDGFSRLRSIIPADGANVSLTYPSSRFPETDVSSSDGYTFSTSSDAYMNPVERDWTGFDGQTTILLTS